LLTTREVYIPTGVYIFKGNLTVAPGVTLQGSFDSVPSHQFPGRDNPMDDGSVRE
jgi:hypothetical protein